MRYFVHTLGIAVITFSGAALANPMRIVDDVYVEQFPGTNHVQVTRTYSYGSTTKVERDGTQVTVAFVSYSGGRQDLGSGLTDLMKVVGCDCSVPVGPHSYRVGNQSVQLDVVPASQATGQAREPSGACDVACAGNIDPITTGGTSGVPTGGSNGLVAGGTTAIVTGGSSSATMGGTSATASGGTSATATAETGGLASGGTVAASGGVGVTSSTSDSSTLTTDSTRAPLNQDDDSGGCSIARTTHGQVPFGILAVLGLLAFRRRK